METENKDKVILESAESEKLAAEEQEQDAASDSNTCTAKTDADTSLVVDAGEKLKETATVSSEEMQQASTELATTTDLTERSVENVQEMVADVHTESLELEQPDKVLSKMEVVVEALGAEATESKVELAAVVKPVAAVAKDDNVTKIEIKVSMTENIKLHETAAVNNETTEASNVPMAMEANSLADTEQLEKATKPFDASKTVEDVNMDDLDSGIKETTSAHVSLGIESELLPNSSETLKTNADGNSKVQSGQSGLSLLAQYASDADESDQSESDTESVKEVPVTVSGPAAASKTYRSQVVEINSATDSDSDSSSTESDTSSVSSADAEYISNIRKTIYKSMNAADNDADSDGDEEGGDRQRRRQPPKVKGELGLEDLPPIQDLHISVPEAECIVLGAVHSIVDQLVLVNALPNSVLLDLETVLFLDKGQRVLGEVFDVLGQVADPLYCVRFNSNQQIHERSINVGDTVFVAPKTEYTQYVVLSSLMKIRGSDASWEHDVEPPPRFLDYSDDEQERAARTKRRNKNRSNSSTVEDGGVIEDDNDAADDASKRARNIDLEQQSGSMASTSSSSAPRAHGYTRGRGGRGGGGGPRGGRGGNSGFQRGGGFAGSGYRARRPMSTPHQGYQQHYQQHNYNADSWHSNFYQPHGPAQHVAYAPPSTPPPLLQNPMYAPPPPSQQYNAYAMGPPQMQQPPPMYVLNPYAVRPAVLAPYAAPQARPMYAAPGQMGQSPPQPPGT